MTGLIDDWADRWLDFKVTGQKGDSEDIRLRRLKAGLEECWLISGLALRWLR